MNYSADDIRVISWPEPVKVRPEMYFRCLGKEGCLELIEELIETILSEKYGCNASEVEVRFTRHEEVVIEYNGIGMPIKLSNIDEITQPIIYTTMMSLMCGEPTCEDYRKYGHLVGIGPIFNAACKTLRISTWANEKSYSLSFYKGCLATLLSETSSSTNSNSLKFVFDSEVMGEFKIEEADLVHLVETLNNKYSDSTVVFNQHKNI